jgi:putative peptidoglycan lipid II flippase
LLAPGLDRASSSAATQATIAAAPALVLLGLAWLVGAYLNAAGRYIVPAMITGVVAIGACLPLLAKRPSPAEAAFGWSIGAAMAFALMLVWAIRASRTPADAAVEALDRSALERTGLLATPLMMLAAVQGSIEIADRIIASHLGLGAITMIALAKKGLHLPSTILVAAVGAVLLPFLSRRETDDERADGFAQMLNLSLFFLLPTAAVLIVTRYEIVRLLFGRGAFGDDDVRVTAALLGLYALALIPVNIAMLLQRSLSTLGTARVALVPYAVSMAGYVLAAWFGSQQIGIRALPVSFAAASCGYAVALLVMLHRRLHFPMPRLLWPAVMTLLATALCSLAMIVVQRALDTSDVISLTATVLSGGLAYVFAISWLAHPAAGDIMAAIRRLRTGTSPTTQPALRVLFDMTFGTGHSGTARYVLSMKRELERIEGVEVIARRSTRLHRGPRLVRVGLNGVMHLTWTMLVVPFIAWRNQVDVIHVTMIAPLHAPCCHDARRS